MAPLTAAEVSSLLAELGPHAETQEKKEALGVSAYRALFGAKPEYINLFSKLQGLTIDNVFIKYYGGTLVTTRNVNKQQFLSGEPIFVDFFKKMQKLLHHIFPIAGIHAL
uniref:Globin (Fragments) n=1 Tax=Dicrocoelium dendriticum TaxID=57078 RepID=GLB_DICDE|nr:RecName: Full=Globin; AltName: Full=Myoglobin [Dicrocoelium dendriticum]